MYRNDLNFSWKQVRVLTQASLRSRYRNTYAGFLWVILNPLLTYIAQGFAFKYVLRIEYQNYPLFLLCGLLPWIFLSSSLNMCASAITTQSAILKSFPIHPLALISSAIVDNLVNFLASFLLILVPLILISEMPAPKHLIIFPLALGSLAIAVIGLTLFVATLQVFFSDTKFVVEFVTSVAFFLTPIIYPSEFIEERYRFIVELNPFSILLRPFQSLSQPELLTGYASELLWSYCLAFVFLGLGASLWSLRKNEVFLRI